MISIEAGSLFGKERLGVRRVEEGLDGMQKSFPIPCLASFSACSLIESIAQGGTETWIVYR